MCRVAGKFISVSFFITNVLVKICQPGIADRQTHDPNLHIINIPGGVVRDPYLHLQRCRWWFVADNFKTANQTKFNKPLSTTQGTYPDSGLGLGLGR